MTLELNDNGLPLDLIGREVDWIRQSATDSQVQAILDLRDRLRERVGQLYNFACLLVHELVECDGLDKDLERRARQLHILYVNGDNDEPQ
jgi:hypothetical protein